MYQPHFNPAAEVVLMLFLTLFGDAPAPKPTRVSLTLPYAPSDERLVTRVVRLEADEPNDDRGWFNFTIPAPPADADGEVQVRVSLV
jgi:hypothetical protein